MTVELVFRFPLGRVHATPWGENPNEGGIEWPPSPWRLLRGLYATWRSRFPDLDGEVVLALLDQLAAPPSFIVPPHALAHSRHYLPGPAHMEGVSTDKSLVLDAFVSVSPEDELIVRWDTDLDGPGRDALATLAGGLTYLGRAESVCDAEARFEPTNAGPAIEQLADEDPATPISLLAPERPLDEEALTVTTTQVRTKLKQREPPATRRLRYPRPVPGPAVQGQLGHARRADLVTTVRWSIASAARPSKYEAVTWADTLRQAAFSTFGGKEKRKAPAILSGKGREGQRSEAQHHHVHWLAFGEPDGRLLSTLVAWAPGGFVDEAGLVDEEILDALANVRFLRSQGIRGVHSCAIGLEGWGRADEIVPELAAPSRIWRSYTPFAPSRHPHRNTGSGQEFYRGCIAKELEWRDRGDVLPAVRVETLGDWHRFRRHRPNKERLSQARRVAGLELEFPAQVDGPILLGSLSHFGLGLFFPVVR